MFIFNFIYMCLLIGTYLYFYCSGTPFPEALRTANTWICWGFLLWGGFVGGRVIVDCILSGLQGQMQLVNVRNGILLAVLDFLPTLLMSLFLMREGFMEAAATVGK
ncbi:MAG: hypothetical protein ABMA02_08325 [Saprospiraceae bacterium]